MSLRTLPQINAFERSDNLQFEADSNALARWNAAIKAASDQDNVISVMEVIGYDWWTGGGVTAEGVAERLAQIDGDVIVHINSPGGDFFEGIAIYNLLREHQGRVTVKILGLAASAASVIAMAGDDIQISKVGFLMIHNAWSIVLGNRHDLRNAADTLEPFDGAMAGLYANRSGQSKIVAAGWMDDETWFNGDDAVEEGLADTILASSEYEETEEQARANANAVRRVDGALARQGIPRSERRSLMGELKKPGTQDAAPNTRNTATTQDAGAEAAAIRSLINTMKGMSK